MTTKHTPGPWSQDKYGAIVDTKGERILTTGLSLTTGYSEDEEPKANARLIAAAPELLAALQLLVEADGCGWLDDTMFEQASAAIAKATNT